MTSRKTKNNGTFHHQNVFSCPNRGLSKIEDSSLSWLEFQCCSKNAMWVRYDSLCVRIPGQTGIKAVEGLGTI